MGKQSNSPPPAPDPKEMARLQAIEDRKTQAANLAASRTSTTNAFGRTAWRRTPQFDHAGFDEAMKGYNSRVQAFHNNNSFGGYGEAAPDRAEYTTDSWENFQELSPDSQNIYDTSTAKLKDAMGNISTDSTRYNQEVADAVQRRMSRYLDPQQAQQRSSMQANLADRGFQVGNEAYKDEMTRMEDSQQMAQADIADRAQITGAQQGLNELSMQQQIAQFLSGMRNNQVAGVSGMPTTTAAPQMQSYDISGAMMDNWADKVDRANAEDDGGPMGTILPIGGAIVGGIYGGPQGAMAGYSIGSAVAGSGKKKGGSKKGGFF